MRGTPIPEIAGTGATPGWRTVVSIFKLRIGTLIMLTALAGLAIASPSGLAAWKIVVLALAVLASSASAGAFNQFVEAESDRLMARTRNRAFARGALPTSGAWLGLIIGLLALAVFVTWFVINAAAAVYLFLGAFTYAVVYTVWLKRRTPMNIVIGGLAGSFAVLTGAAAADPAIGMQPLLLAFVLFLWTPPHFWSLAIAKCDDYAGAGIPMLPVVVGTQRAAQIVHWNAVLLVAASLLPLAFGAGPAYLVGAVVGGAWFLRHTWALMRDPQRKTAFGSFFASMVQLSALIVGIWIDAALR